MCTIAVKQMQDPVIKRWVNLECHSFLEVKDLCKWINFTCAKTLTEEEVTKWLLDPNKNHTISNMGDKMRIMVKATDELKVTKVFDDYFWRIYR